MSREIEHLEATTRERFALAVEEYNRLGTGLAIVIVETWRDAVAQQAAFDSGASASRPGRSFHNPVDEHGKPLSYAVDFELRDATTGRRLRGFTNDDWKLYAEATVVFKRFGFRWSGDWPKAKGRTIECGHVNAPITLEEAHRGLTPRWPDLEVA